LILVDPDQNIVVANMIWCCSRWTYM